eukprot:jgi/Bigna1/127770/aug1.5_g2478
MTNQESKTIDMAEELLQQGRKSLKERQYEKACEILSQALQIKCQEKGEEDIACAPYHYEYGKALLDCTRATRNLLGAQAASNMEAEDGSNDMEIGWEVLEVSRKIYTKALMEGANSKVKLKLIKFVLSKVLELLNVLHNSNTNLFVGKKKEHKLALAEVHISLAEYSRESEDFEESYKDFGSALDLFEGCLEKDDRQIAFAHQMMANDSIYAKKPQRAEKHFDTVRNVLAMRMVNIFNSIAEVSNKRKILKEKNNGKAAKTPVDMAAKVLDSQLKKVSDGCEEISKMLKEINELKELREEVLEQIRGLRDVPAPEKNDKKDMSNILQALASQVKDLAGADGKQQSSTSSSGATSSGTTKIGFGTDTSSSGTTTIGFGTSPASQPTQTTQVLQVTRKRPPEKSRDTSAAEGSKKAKTAK